EVRLARKEADHFRPYDAARGTSLPLVDQPLQQLARLQQRGDLQGVGEGYLLTGDPARAVAYLERAGSSPEVRSDRAAALLSRGDPEAALVTVDEALSAHPALPQALWNRGLILERLGLTLLAAESFDAVAALGEPDWSGEARRRAAGLRTATTARGAGWT